jgi:signal transduction histidine kinase
VPASAESPAAPAPATPAPAAPPAAEAPPSPRSLLLAHISHGFRTPLNAIIGFAEIMEREMFGKIGIPRYIDYVRDIRASAQHLLRLVEDVVDLAKAEARALELEESPIDVAAAVRSVILMQRERAGRGGVQLIPVVPGDFPRLTGDRRRVRQILHNLISNAVRFTARGGRVGISARVDGAGGIVLAVSDTGRGIKPAEIPRIFDPLAGLSRLRAGAGGAGLGLPLCKGLMELHGGSLALASQPGRGTTVTASFPPWRTVKASLRR